MKPKVAERSMAVELRKQGFTVPDIAAALGVARSTAYAWTRSVPLADSADRAERRRLHSKRMTDAQWAAHRVDRDARREEILADGSAEGRLRSDRELLLIGAAIYWCEGAKTKPWRPTDWRVLFTNSDPVLLEVFLRFLELLDRPRSSLTYRVQIHATADAYQAQRWWEAKLGLAEGLISAVTLKHHVPSASRHNQGADYHGCLVVTVPKSREIYWRIEGIMAGLASSG